MRPLLLLTLLATVGCEQDLLAGLDASTQRCSNGTPAAATYLLYLNTEGVTLTAGTSDARINVSDLVTPDAPHVVPPFLDGVATRRAFIDQIVADAQSRLAPYSIDIVTVRPTAGDYYMFVMGGDPMTVLGKPCDTCTGVTDIDCKLLSRDSVDLIFDSGIDEGFTAASYASQVLGDLGLLLGLPVTTSPGDCMCRFCSVTDLCAYGVNAATDATDYGLGFPVNCGFTPTDDETIQLEATLGCR